MSSTMIKLRPPRHILSKIVFVILCGVCIWCADVVATANYANIRLVALAVGLACFVLAIIAARRFTRKPEDFYVGMSVLLPDYRNPDAPPIRRTITKYDGTTKTATVAPNWAEPPTASHTYTIKPDAQISETEDHNEREQQ